MNTGVQYLFDIVILFPLDLYQGIYMIVRSYVVLFLILLRNVYTVFHSVCTSLHFHHQYIKVLLSPRPSKHLSFVVFLISHSKMCEVIPSGFDLHFPENSDVKHLFIYLWVTCMSSLEKYLFIKSLNNIKRLKNHWDDCRGESI